MSEQKHIRDVNCAINFKAPFHYYYFNIPSSPPPKNIKNCTKAKIGIEA